MNIYLQEFKSIRKSLIIWTCSIVALAALYLGIYPEVSQDMESFRKLFEAYPKEVLSMLGVDINLLTSFLGFYSMIFTFVVICGAIQAMNLGLTVLSRESRERTADFLLVKPVTRSTIVTSKLLAAFTALLVTNIVFCGGTTLFAHAFGVGNYDEKLFFMINLTLFFIQIIFFALGVFISVFFNKLKSVLPISLGLVFGLYMIGALLVTDKEDAVRYVIPFKYYDTIHIIKNASYETTYLVLSAVIIAITVIASYIIYNRKDIHAVA